MTKWALAWSFLGLVLAGCGGSATTALRSDNVRLQEKVNELRAQARRDRNKKRDLENQVYLLKDKLDRDKEIASDAAEPSLPVQVLAPSEPAPAADPGYQLAGVDDEGNQIVYVGDAASDRTVSPKLDQYVDDDDPAPAPSGPAIVEPRRGSSDRLPITSNVPRVPTVAAQMRQARRHTSANDSARALYQRHYAALRAGDHAGAIAGFRAFLQQYPHSDYADNAQYWLGEAFYDQRQYKVAMREFRRVVNNYPHGNKVPDALLKIGFCYAALGETSKARDVLEEVTRVYPASNPAKLAQSRLAELARGK